MVAAGPTVWGRSDPTTHTQPHANGNGWIGMTHAPGAVSSADVGRGGPSGCCRGARCRTRPGGWRRGPVHVKMAGFARGVAAVRWFGGLCREG